MLDLIDVDALLRRGCESRARIGIGASESVFEATTANLRSRSCPVDLVRFDSSGGLISALRSGDIAAAVRGTLSSSSVLPELRAAFDLSEIMRTAVMRTLDGRPFLLTPVGIDEGCDPISRKSLVSASLSYFSQLGWSISVGVLSKGRVDDGDRGEEIGQSIADAEGLTASLRAEGVDAAHYEILLENAIRTCDLVVAPDGISGNLIFRALHLVGGLEAFGAPVVNMDAVFVDTSRAKSDFSDAVMLAAGLKLL